MDDAIHTVLLYVIQAIMIRLESFATHSVSYHPHGDDIARILASAIQAVEPGNAVRHFVHREGNSLFIGKREYSLDKIGRVHILGLGKACAAMTLPLADLLSDLPTDAAGAAVSGKTYAWDGGWAFA